MKIQDFVFFLTLVGLWFMPGRNKYLYAGLLSLILAIPLFAKWIFFTAERLTWYAVAFILVHTTILLRHIRKG